eukprot:10398721-Alexandrium_andersonii.AAC.2
MRSHSRAIAEALEHTSSIAFGAESSCAGDCSQRCMWCAGTREVCAMCNQIQKQPEQTHRMVTASHFDNSAA